MRLRKRVESLETKAAPKKLERWHIVAMAEDETQEAAMARHWEPIASDDSVVFIRKPTCDEATVAGSMTDRRAGHEIAE